MSDSLSTQVPLIVIYDEAAALFNPPSAAQLHQAEQALRTVLNSPVSGGSTGDIGRDLRLELRDELSATQTHEHLVRVRLAANTDPNAARTLAALEAHETELWDAIGNALLTP